MEKYLGSSKLAPSTFKMFRSKDTESSIASIFGLVADELIYILEYPVPEVLPKKSSSSSPTTNTPWFVVLKESSNTTVAGSSNSSKTTPIWLFPGASSMPTVAGSLHELIRIRDAIAPKARLTGEIRVNIEQLFVSLCF